MVSINNADSFSDSSPAIVPLELFRTKVKPLPIFPKVHTSEQVSVNRDSRMYMNLDKEAMKNTHWYIKTVRTVYEGDQIIKLSLSELWFKWGFTLIWFKPDSPIVQSQAGCCAVATFSCGENKSPAVSFQRRVHCSHLKHLGEGCFISQEE